ncbi:T9SS type A sorting domain-containing protein, partial [Bacteroidota bacterium]
NAPDGGRFPYEEYVDFDLGQVEGAFNLKLDGYFTDRDDVPYISRFQGLINIYHSTDPTVTDYRHIDTNEVLEMIISDLKLTDGFGFFLEGIRARQGLNDIIIIENASGQKDTIVGDTDDNTYYVLNNSIPVSSKDTIRIRTLAGKWRLDNLTFVMPKEYAEEDNLRYLGAEEISESTYSVSSFGRYYLRGDHTPANYPDGLVAIVVNEENDTIRHTGTYPSESEVFYVDLGILRQGDHIRVKAGVGPGDDPEAWNLKFERKPLYYSTHYPDPDELPLAKASPLENLEIFKYGHPRVFSFRNDYVGQGTYERFFTTVVQAQGASPKNLAEERIPSQENLPKIQRYAAEHPEKLILNHFNFKRAMIEWVPEMYEFFSPAHWLYYPGTYLTDDLPADDSIAHVKTSSFFKAPNTDGTAIGNDVVILIPVDSLDHKQWHLAEFAAVKKIENDTLNLKRSILRTASWDHAKGTYMAVLQTNIGDSQGYQVKETNVFYNFSSNCPTDSLGRNCGDAFVEFYANYLRQGGIFERFHGLMADVLVGNNEARPLYPGERYARIMDCDVDGRADNGFDERGYNMVSYGQYEFARKFRKMLGPNRIWTADGNNANWPRIVPFLSGMESEGFDHHHDAFLKGWSRGVNLFYYYNHHISQPWKFNVAVPKINDFEEEFPENTAKQHQLRRLARAVTTIMELNNCSNGVKTGTNTPVFWIADDYVMGVADSTQWLGDPVGDIIRPAKDSADLLQGIGQNITPYFINNWSGDNATIYKEGDALCMEGKEEGLGVTQERMIIRYPLDIPEGDLFVRFMVKADSLRAFPADIPRFFFVTVNGLQSTEWTWETLEGIAGNQSYQEMSFYYRHAGPANGTVEIEFEGYEKVWIKDFTVHNAQDVMAREFENGVVLVNPSADPFLFNIPEMFPNKSFRFIEGNKYEEFIGLNNTGNPVQGPVLLNAHSGQFLVKDKSETMIPENANASSDITIYPVPAGNSLNIMLNARKNGEFTLFIQDIQGKTVYAKTERVFAGENHLKIKSVDLNGFYFLQLVNEGIRLSRKVIFNSK